MAKVLGMHRSTGPTLTATLLHQEASGAGGGNTVAAYSARKLNTVADPSGIILNAASFTGVGGTNTQIQLGAGSYEVSGSLSYYSVNNYIKCRLYNVTDASVVAVGLNGLDTNGAAEISVRAAFTISSTKTFEIQTYGGSYTNGNGIPSSYGDNEVYANIVIRKIGAY